MYSTRNFCLSTTYSTYIEYRSTCLVSFRWVLKIDAQIGNPTEFTAHRRPTGAYVDSRKISQSTTLRFPGLVKAIDESNIVSGIEVALRETEKDVRAHQHIFFLVCLYIFSPGPASLVAARLMIPTSSEDWQLYILLLYHIFSNYTLQTLRVAPFISPL